MTTLLAISLLVYATLVPGLCLYYFIRYTNRVKQELIKKMDFAHDVVRELDGLYADVKDLEFRVLQKKE